MLLALFTPALAGVLVNELVYQTSESGDETEWVELCNTGPDTVDLTGYTLQAATTSWSTQYTFGAVTIAPGEYVVIGTGTYAASITLGNATSNADGVRLADGSGAVVDTVLYGSPNSDVLADDAGSTAALGPESGDDESIGRWPDCADSDDASADFVVYAAPSPGTANAEPSGGGGGTADCSGAEGVKINELVPAAAGDDAGQEWVELYNGGAAAVTLDGWVFQWDGSDFDSASDFEIPAGTVLEPGAFLVIGAGGLSASLNMGNAGSNADGARLVCNDVPVDTVVYGTPNSDNLPDDSGAAATSTAPEPVDGRSLARPVDGADTDASGVDFEVATPTPGATNAGVAGDCAGGVVVNEFTIETGVEWIELYNGAGRDVDLTGWALEFGTQSFSNLYDLPAGTVLPAGDWLVIGSPGAAVKDLETDLQDLGNASSNTDGLRLTCSGDAVDTVIYGKDTAANSDAWVDDTGAVATSWATVPSGGLTAARLVDGLDTDQSGDDFALATPTPGAANPYTEPPVCDPTGFEGLKINELVYNPEGSDDDQEWVELVNAGDATIHLDGTVIETATQAWSQAYVFPGGIDLEPGAFVVVGAENAGFDLVGDVGLGNGTGGDGLRVVDCEGNVVDTVLWGEDAEGELTDDAGGTDLVPDPGEGMSIGRYPDGADTDTITDWHAFAEITPGDPNPDPGATGGGGEEGKPGGCGDRPDEAGKPEGGCASVLPLGGLEAALAALALLRRRRR